MKDVTEAAQIANRYLLSFFPHAKNIKLEEIELDEEREYWFITLSYFDKQQTEVPTFIPFEKNYKTFKIHSETGEVFSMKIRELQ